MRTNKTEILKIACDMWRENRSIPTVRALADRLNVSHGSVLYHWKSIGLLHNAMALYAVTEQDKVLLSILVVTNHPAVSLFSEAERSQVLTHRS